MDFLMSIYTIFNILKLFSFSQLIIRENIDVSSLIDYKDGKDRKN
jgi:hypothetical protein